jgi:predicted hydrolase (HD superfamily)
MDQININEAYKLIEYSSKRHHSILVSRIMKTLAVLFDESEELWTIVGLLHDYDYDQVKDFSQHGVLTAEQLNDKLPTNALQAIKAHDIRTGVKPEGLMDEAIIFADSLAKFIESNEDIKDSEILFEAKPWVWKTLTEFTDKHELDILGILTRLAI